jgi:glycosyltransferase involved in cell wall biosynthesis
VDRLRVLVYNSTPIGVCDFYRTWMFQPYLDALGVELRSWRQVAAPEPTPDGRLAWSHRAPLEWADVLLLRRGDQTHHLCFDCRFASPEGTEAAAHARASGHRIQRAANEFLRPLWEALTREPRLFAGRAIVYETDDDLLRVPAWNGNRRILAPERGLIETMARRADLVTVSTPVLATRLRPYTDRIRVIRNAVDRRWYEAAQRDDSLPGSPRVLHYGNLSRLAYYEVCRDAVDEAKRRHPDLRRVWLGAPDEPDARGRIEAVVDEVHDYVIGVPAFAAALVRAAPDIGLAPLLGDEFDRAKSELHWLEYALAGAVTIASRTMEAGPYSVIRHGVDGFLVKGKAEWLDTLLALVRSPDLRAEVAGRARERVLADYDAAQRAAEWADALRWAAEHAGIGAMGRSVAVSAEAAAAVRTAARAALRHRRRVDRWQAAAAARLGRLRDAQIGAPPGRTADPTLVSVVVPVVDAPPTAASGSLLEQSIESVLDGLHGAVEVLVVGEATGRTGPPADRRVRWLVPPAPTGAGDRWAHWARAANRGLAAARGAWIATLEPGIVFAPEHLALLLEVARDEGLEAVYGWLAEPDGRRAGGWPPDPEDVPAGCELVSAILSFVRFDPRAHLLGRSPVAERWRRLVALGARVGNVETVVARRLPDAPSHQDSHLVAAGSRR